MSLESLLSVNGALVLSSTSLIPAGNSLSGLNPPETSLFALCEAFEYLLLISFPEANTPVCSTELSVISENKKRFEDRGTGIVIITPDDPAKIADWLIKFDCAGINVFYSSYSPKPADLEIAHARYTELLDCREFENLTSPSPVVFYWSIFDNLIGRNIEELIRVIDARETGDLCPEASSML
jgi:hypothetical protein